MFNVVDPATKKLTAVEPVSFSSIGVKERQDLEAWAVSHPETFGEKLLVITSEFDRFDRFDRSDRRLDILAIDEVGCLVVIELKLALSGSFADQQAIRYAAFCSAMTMADVVDVHARYLNGSEEDARKAIAKFLGEEELPELNSKPRIILAGGDLDDQELTSTVLWLRTFGVDISCVEITPYRLADSGSLLLVPRVIIPLPEARDYLIRVERKQAGGAGVAKEREARSQRWQSLSEKFNRLNLDWKARARSSKNYLQIPVGHREMHYEWLLQQRQKSLRVALHFESDDREVNQRRMSRIQERSAEIRAGIKHPFVAEMWGRRWATAEFRIPWDSQLVNDESLDEAVRVMKLLIERTQTDVERFKLEQRPTSMPQQRLTLFTWGYYGWGNHTPELVEAVDSVEASRSFAPPLFVDIRIRRAVRAVGFTGPAFEKLLGRDRHRWMRSLGNLHIVTRTGPNIARRFMVELPAKENSEVESPTHR